MGARITLTVGLAMLAAGVAFNVAAAGQSSSRRSFEASSVKKNVSGQRGTAFSIRGTTFTATNASAQRLLARAYGMQPYQLEGAPQWLDEDRFDVSARIGTDADASSAEIVNDMLKDLLATRFSVVVHHDKRMRDGYTLLRQGPGAANGLTKNDGWCLGAPGQAPDGVPRLECQMSVSRDAIIAKSITLDELARSLSTVLGRPVTNGTELTGRFDFSLRWLDPLSSAQSSGADGPALSTALMEQLGLRLQSISLPMEVLVIDRVQQPAAD